MKVKAALAAEVRDGIPSRRIINRLILQKYNSENFIILLYFYKCHAAQGNLFFHLSLIRPKILLGRFNKNVSVGTRKLVNYT